MLKEIILSELILVKTYQYFDVFKLWYDRITVLETRFPTM
jgi:hypothetical protein